MHYKNGKEARDGDPVIWRPNPEYDATYAGKIHNLTTGETCNGTIAIPVIGGVEQRACINTKDCYHAADAYNAMIILENSRALAAASEQGKAPPISNEHVAKGCEQFTAPTA